MVEQILPGMYRIPVPLPELPLGNLNSYVIKAPEQVLVVDTGLNRIECQEALTAGLRELDVDPAEATYFITHMHSDHLALSATIAGPSSTIYLSAADAAIVNAGGGHHHSEAHARRHGFPAEKTAQTVRAHPGYRYGLARLVPFTSLEDGHVLSIGPYRFECLITPGHSPGHTCLYERSHKLLISGDHILGDITSNISSWRIDGDPLGWYLASLDRVAKLEVDRALPGHRTLIPDCQGRIRELKRHHEERLQEVRSLVRSEGQTAYEVAAQMTWDIVAKSWDDFPLAQQWFATGEALSHLIYLSKRGFIRLEDRDGVVVFSTL